VGFYRLCFTALVLAVAYLASGPAQAAKPSATPFLGQGPGDAQIKEELINDIRRFPEAERVALLEITLLCEVDRAALSRKRLYDPWEKRCKKTEALWTTKYRTQNQNRMIDIQMRLYQDRRRSLSRTAARYFAQKATVARKVKRREDIRNDVKEAVRLRKKLAAISTEMLKFFFALRDIIAEAKK
jgi:hypothetical protein